MLSGDIKVPKLESDLNKRELTSCLSKKIVCARRLEWACYGVSYGVKCLIKILEKVMRLGQIGVCLLVYAKWPVRLRNCDYPGEAGDRFPIETRII